MEQENLVGNQLPQEDVVLGDADSNDGSDTTIEITTSGATSANYNNAHKLVNAANHLTYSAILAAQFFILHTVICFVTQGNEDASPRLTADYLRVLLGGLALLLVGNFTFKEQAPRMGSKPNANESPIEIGFRSLPDVANAVGFVGVATLAQFDGVDSAITNTLAAMCYFSMAASKIYPGDVKGVERVFESLVRAGALAASITTALEVVHAKDPTVLDDMARIMMHFLTGGLFVTAFLVQQSATIYNLFKKEDGYQQLAATGTESPVTNNDQM